MQYKFESFDLEDLNAIAKTFVTLTLTNQEKIAEYVYMLRDLENKYLAENPMVKNDQLNDQLNYTLDRKIASYAKEKMAVDETPNPIKIFVQRRKLHCPKCHHDEFVKDGENTAYCTGCLTKIDIPQTWY